MDYNNKILMLASKFAQFFSDTTRGQILAIICPYTFPIDYDAFGLPDRRLDSWDFDTQLKAFVEYNVKRHRAFMDVVGSIDNDYVPAMNLNFGYGVHSAYFSGAPVIMGNDTSWTRPFLTDWSMLGNLRMGETTYWYRKIMEGYKYLVKMQDGDYAISGFANAGPGDMANAVRGDALFTDLYDAPEEVHSLMGKCSDAAIWLEESIARLVGAGPAGGSVTANCWFPGSAPYISEDFNDLCSPAQYEQFGRRYTRKIIDHFGGAYIHHHAKGAHIHGLIANLPGLKMLEQSWDPQCSPPIERLEELFEMHQTLPLMIRCHARDVYKHIEGLKRGRVVIMLNVDSLQQGREVMRFIRRHSKLS